MKRIIPVIITFTLGFILSYFLPWWNIAIVTCFVAIYYKHSPLEAFALGFSSATLIWLAYAGFLNYQNAGILSTKIGKLMMNMNQAQLMAVTSFIAGTTGGLGAVFGAYLIPIFNKSDVAEA